MARVTLDSVTKRYETETAVEDISLEINDGEVLGVIGPSGCGKTTTLRTIAGFETPTVGEIRFDGTPVTNVPPEERNVGLVFQSYALFDNMTVLENVAFGLKMRGVDEATRRDQAMELLELVGIGEQAQQNPRQLSGGQQQRVGLARALAIEPNILLLDEPMTGLDAKLKTRLQRELGALLSELGVTALYVTHDQEEAMVMCDRIAVMNDGHIEQLGTPREIYERPANEFVAQFVGTANLVSGTVTDGALDLGFTTLPVDGDHTGSRTAVVRPEAITVGTGPISGTVSNVYYLGDELRATVTLPTGEALDIELDPGVGSLSHGETVALKIDPSRIHLLE